MKQRILVFGMGILLIGASACSSVKPYQRAYLNDPLMQFSGLPGTTFEHYVHSIRTGSTVAGSKKATGGCGCN